MPPCSTSADSLHNIHSLTQLSINCRWRAAQPSLILRMRVTPVQVLIHLHIPTLLSWTWTLLAAPGRYQSNLLGYQSESSSKLGNGSREKANHNASGHPKHCLRCDLKHFVDSGTIFSTLLALVLRSEDTEIYCNVFYCRHFSINRGNEVVLKAWLWQFEDTRLVSGTWKRS